MIDQETEQTLKYIREQYGVPAEVGRRVRYEPAHTAPTVGVIVGTSGSYLRVRYPEFPGTALHHPTWCLTYLDCEECQS
jgi:hypothetical protein